MNIEETGQVVAHLLQHRIVETRPANGRSSDEQREVAKLLLNIDRKSVV